LLKINKDKNNYYTSVLINKTLVGLWFDEPAPAAAHTVNATDDDCKNAALLLNGVSSSMASARFALVQNPTAEGTHLRCYVQGTFPDDASFLNFFAWSNPTSTTGELFHVNFSKPNGTHSTVWVRVTHSVP